VKNFWNSSIKKKLLAAATATTTTNFSNGNMHLNYLPTTITPNLNDDIGGTSSIFPSLANSIVSPNFIFSHPQSLQNQEASFPMLNINNNCNQIVPILQGFDPNELPLSQVATQNIGHHLPASSSGFDPIWALGFQHVLNEGMSLHHPLQQNHHPFIFNHEQDSSHPSVPPLPPFDNDPMAIMMMMGVGPVLPKLQECGIPSSSSSHDIASAHEVSPLINNASSSSCVLNLIPSFKGSVSNAPHHLERIFPSQLKHTNGQDNHDMIIPSLPSSSSSSSPRPPSSSVAVSAGGRGRLPCDGNQVAMNPSHGHA